MLNSCKDKINDFDTQIESLNRVEDVIKEAEQKIHDTAIQFIADIRNKEKNLVDELRNLYGKDLMDQVDNKKDMATSVEGLRSTCNLTEVILKGKDIELLLLKKDVQKKLSLLGDIDIKPLPGSVSKTVIFLPGEFNLGVLYDEDRPVLSKMKARKMRAAGERGAEEEDDDEEEIEYANSASQTDLKHTEIKVKGDDSDSESEDESDSDDSDESESESEDEKPEMKDSGVQTEKKGESSEEESDDEEEKPEMVDRSTETEEVCTEEKGVNTRSRSLQSVNSPNNRRSPNKDNKEDSDTSLAARRRRRRERASTTSIGSYQPDVPDSTDSYDDVDRRKTRQSRFLYNHSMDDDYYDTNRRRTTAY